MVVGLLLVACDDGHAERSTCGCRTLTIRSARSPDVVAERRGNTAKSISSARKGVEVGLGACCSNHAKASEKPRCQIGETPTATQGGVLHVRRTTVARTYSSRWRRGFLRSRMITATGS